MTILQAKNRFGRIGRQTTGEDGVRAGSFGKFHVEIFNHHTNMFNFAAVKRFYRVIVSGQIREFTVDIGEDFKRCQG